MTKIEDIRSRLTFVDILLDRFSSGADLSKVDQLSEEFFRQVIELSGIEYCLYCASRSFRNWQGLPWNTMRDLAPDLQRRFPRLPDIPLMIEHRCPECDGEEPVRPGDIAYYNVGEGLADHWELVFRGQTAPDAMTRIPDERFQECLDRFGYPYPDHFLDQKQIYHARADFRWRLRRSPQTIDSSTV